MEKRYKALRIIGTLYKVLGIIMLSVTVLVVIGICGTSIIGGAAIENFSREFGSGANFTGFFGSAFGGLMVSLVVILYGGIISLTTYAFGEGIYLLLAMEENTRSSAMLLQRQLTSAPPSPVVPQQPAYSPPEPTPPAEQPDQANEKDDEEIPPAS